MVFLGVSALLIPCGLIKFGYAESNVPAPTVSSATAASSGSSIGKVVISKGDVREVVGNKQVPLKEGDSVEAGGVVKTGAQGAVKILLRDNTSLSLGADSSLNLDDVKNQKTPSIHLAEGQIRAKVMKNLIADAISNHPIKFIIRTKSAAMGVRGTDFEVVYHAANSVTSLITFEGAVAMVKVDPGQADDPGQSTQLAALLTSNKAQVVTEGHFSSANPALPQATVPVKMSPAQFESMKRTDITSNTGASGGAHGSSGGPGGGSAGGSSKSFVSPIPPGVDPKSFSSNSGTLDKQVGAALGVAPEAVKAQVMTPQAAPGGAAAATAVNGFTVAPAPPPEGQFNAKTGSYAPPAGGFVDLKTGLYIPPPPGSAFDPNTGVYTPPASLGKFDAATGNYVPPANFQLDAKQGLVPVSSSAEGALGAQSGGSAGARAPASGDSSKSNPLGAQSPPNGANSGGNSLSSAGSPTLAVTPGFSALTVPGNGEGGGAVPAGGGVLAGIPSVSIPGMIGGVVPGMPVPGSNGGLVVGGYGAPLVSNLPPQPIINPINSTTNGSAPLSPTTTASTSSPSGSTSGSGTTPVAPPPPAPVEPPPAAPPPPPPSLPTGTDPACPFCPPPAPPPTAVVPTSTKVGFSFTVR